MGRLIDIDFVFRDLMADNVWKEFWFGFLIDHLFREFKLIESLKIDLI